MSNNTQPTNSALEERQAIRGARAAEARATCDLCGGLGWILECDTLGSEGPMAAEIMPCLIPDCPASGRPLARVSFSGLDFQEVARKASGEITAVGKRP